MSTDIHIDTDQILMEDFPLLLKFGRGELDGEEFLALCERISPGARKLPIRYLHVFADAINKVLKPRPN